jgi:hypothetical protein
MTQPTDDQRRESDLQRLRYRIGTAITAVYVAAAVAAFAFDERLTGLVTVMTPVMVPIVTGLFCVELLKRGNGKD